MKRDIKWERANDFLHTNDEENLEFHNHYNSDYIVYPKSKENKVMITEKGPVTGKDFNVWLGHTNFPISKREVGILQDTDGLECFKIISPYRIEIYIGKLFTGKDIRDGIKKRICSEISGKSEWAILSKNNKVVYLKGLSIEDVQEQINKEGETNLSVKIIKTSW